MLFLVLRNLYLLLLQVEVPLPPRSRLSLFRFDLNFSIDSIILGFDASSADISEIVRALPYNKASSPPIATPSAIAAALLGLNDVMGIAI